MTTPGHRFVREYVAAHEETQPECAARRTRVLAYPDLAQRLTKPPFGITNPEQWNGWIPPKTLPEDTCPACAHPPGDKDVKKPPRCAGWDHTRRANDSPTRKQLVNIAAEALRRDREQGQPPPANDDQVALEAARAELANRRPAPMPGPTAPTTTEET